MQCCGRMQATGDENVSMHAIVLQRSEKVQNIMVSRRSYRHILYIMELRRSVFLGPFRILRGVPYS